MSKDPELRSKTRSSTAALKDLDIGGIIQNELSKYLHSDEFGDTIKASLSPVYRVEISALSVIQNSIKIKPAIT
jgi:hypothetical protein